MSFEFSDVLWPWMPNIAMADGTLETLFKGSFDISMGGANSWVLGMPFGCPFAGVNINVLGSERKVVAAIGALLGLAGPGPVAASSLASGLIFGLSGHVEVIVHNKVQMGFYGQKFIVERRSHPEFVYKSSFAEANMSERLLRASQLRYGFLVLAMSVFAARILYLINGDKDSLAITILQMAVPSLEFRWLFYVAYLEKGYGLTDKLAKETEAANARLALDQEKLLALTNAALGATPLLFSQSGQAFRQVGKLAKNLLGLGEGIAKEVVNVVDLVGEHAAHVV
jgi:hypothetical protein